MALRAYSGVREIKQNTRPEGAAAARRLLLAELVRGGLEMQMSKMEAHQTSSSSGHSFSGRSAVPRHSGHSTPHGVLMREPVAALRGWGDDKKQQKEGAKLEKQG